MTEKSLVQQIIKERRYEYRVFDLFANRGQYEQSVFFDEVASLIHIAHLGDREDFREILELLAELGLLNRFFGHLNADFGAAADKFYGYKYPPGSSSCITFPAHGARVLDKFFAGLGMGVYIQEKYNVWCPKPTMEERYWDYPDAWVAGALTTMEAWEDRQQPKCLQYMGLARHRVGGKFKEIRRMYSGLHLVFELLMPDGSNPATNFRFIAGYDYRSLQVVVCLEAYRGIWEAMEWLVPSLRQAVAYFETLGWELEMSVEASLKMFREYIE